MVTKPEKGVQVVFFKAKQVGRLKEMADFGLAFFFCNALHFIFRVGVSMK